MRVSERQRYHVANDRVQNARQQNVQTLEQISSLKKINQLSDDPIGVSKVVRFRDQIETVGQMRKNVDFSKGYVDRAESAIQSMTDNLIRAQELSVSLANGTYDASSRDAAAAEVAQILNEVVSLGNSTYAGRYIFSGFRTKTPALSPDGDYQGDDGAIFLQVDDGDFRQINLQARELFEADETDRAYGHQNLVDTLSLLHVGLKDNSLDQIRAAMSELEHQIEKTTSAQASLGALGKALDSGQRKLEAENVRYRELLAEVEEVDMFQASTDFQRAETVLQSTLLATNKMLQPSLINFMQ